VVGRAEGPCRGAGSTACAGRHKPCTAKARTIAPAAPAAPIAAASLARRRPGVRGLCGETCRWRAVRWVSTKTVVLPSRRASPHYLPQQAVHHPGLVYVLAPLRNAATAAGLLMPKS
jgi:hypothetical protein